MSVSVFFRPRAFAAAAATSISSRSSAGGLRAAPKLSILNMARKQSTVPEGYVEDHSKGAMLRFEDSLPKLPVPSLRETSQRYLKSIHPLLSRAEYDNSVRAVEEFVKPGGQGEVLQQRLEDRAARPDIKNWLAEWWNNAAYLGDRGPVVPYVSYFYAHRDDRARRDPAKRAAAITTAVLDFKRQVDYKSLEPEYMRKEPIAMSSYWWMFNACRIPGEPADYPVKYNAEEHPYIVVIRKNKFFKVLYEVDGKQLNTTELEQSFRRIYEIAEKVPAVGALTSERRNKWFEMRNRLMEASPANISALDTIQASAFVVCLDDARPITLEERAHSFWHGDGQNRWYDKPLQFIINDNGVSGFQGEHSMMDGTPTHRLNDEINAQIFGNTLDFDNPSMRSNLPEPVPIHFTINEDVGQDIAAAREFHARTIAEHELVVQAYQGYGKGLIKKFRCSPDGYVQMIIQLAYKKMYGKNRPTYESAATRKFQEGRTETSRTVSDESVAFCNAMENPQMSARECENLFRAALQSQGKYIADASAGHGVDRHLFGLKKCLQEGEETPDIFTDPAYSYSNSWHISSSQLSSEYFNGYGWSQVIDEGFGIAYMINEHSINFNIVSKGLGCQRMSHYLREAAGDIRDVMNATAGKGERPKL